MKVNKSTIKFYASAKAVINQFLFLPGENRVKNIVERVKNFSEKEVDEYLQKVNTEFGSRHRFMDSELMKNFEKVSHQYKGDLSNFSPVRKMLLGSYFTKEYSIQAAALFNPSIVPHPDQSGLEEGEQRFVMSLRATGEGHISSIIFKTGIIDKDLKIKLDANSGYFTKLKKYDAVYYEKRFIKERCSYFINFNNSILDPLPVKFSAREALHIVEENFSEDHSIMESIKHLETILDTNYELHTVLDIPINEKVIFPNAKCESMGMEDVRFVFLNDGEKSGYYGTYTAYDGHQIKTQMIETKDFENFKIRTLYGNAISDKGMALFPEKVNGKYVMISRQGGEKINIMFSEDLYFWEDYRILMEPKFEWELVQLGNCGSPVKTDKGWLLLTHGVGAMRTYVISAILLDLNDPTKIIGRLEKPLIQAIGEEREGYVPNVVYTCGLMRHLDALIIPYAVSDSATGFVTSSLSELLNELINTV